MSELETKRKKHKHAELIKAWADGAVIQQRINNEWVNIGNYTTWADSDVYRIQSNCEYAISKIREIGGDEAAELYEYWLGGVVIEVRNNCYIGTSTPFSEIEVTDDPFQYFKIFLKGHQLRKKKQTVKEVLWVSSNVTMCIQAFWHREGLNPNSEIPGRPAQWHKVPTLTREVEK